MIFILENLNKKFFTLLFLITIVAHFGVIGNPGFLSHDEWEKFDHVERYGLAHFAAAYGRVIAGPEFGFPVRPLGFLQQAVSSQWMQVAPFIPHTIDVLLHFSVAAILLLALLDLGARRFLALTAAVAFTTSPLTTMATGWVAASFDQWYTLFVVFACWLAFKVSLSGITTLRGLGLVAAAAGAILSKETALILPGAVLLSMAAAWLCKTEGERFKIASALIVVILVTIPLIAYLEQRWPALENTLAGRSHSAYTPSLFSLQQNLFAYFAFPFVPQITEFRGLERYPRSFVALAVLLHGSLIAGIWFYAGRLWSVLYLLAYTIFVTPVLPLPLPLGHYIYGSAVPMALAIAAVLQGAWVRRHVMVLSAMVLGAGLLAGNTLLIQRWMYLDGVCQTVFLASLDNEIAAEPSRDGLTVLIVPVTAVRSGGVARRAVFSRWRYSGESGSPRVTFDASTSSSLGSPLRLSMASSCEVTRALD